MSDVRQGILESKRALRRDLAARPIADKLRMLDTLRERELAIRGRHSGAAASILREDPPALPREARMNGKQQSGNGEA
jgi:hypothetical protein